MLSKKIKRSKVPELPDYKLYKPYLRRDFLYTCCFCGVTERLAQTIEFQIDHYHPTSKGGAETEYKNLMLCCKHCNQRKLAYWSEDVGARLVKSDEQDPSDHIKPEHQQYKGLTSNGTKTIERLGLNERETLKRIRRKLDRRVSDLNKIGSRIDLISREIRRRARRGNRQDCNKIVEMRNLLASLRREYKTAKLNYVERSYSEILGEAEIPKSASIVSRAAVKNP